MASGHVNRATGRTHGRTDQCCIREESPCQLGAVHTWRRTTMTRGGLLTGANPDVAQMWANRGCHDGANAFPFGTA